VGSGLLTFSAGPVQAYTAWRCAHPSVRKHWRWFVFFGLVSQLAYVEVKNVIARTAHIKEAMRERRWKVTPRAVPRVQAPEAQPVAAGGRSTANGSVTSSLCEVKR
jgi:hypothetical protein